MKAIVTAFGMFLWASIALADEMPVEIRVGAPTYIKAPPGSATAGSAWLKFPVRVTNTSPQPVWLHGRSLDSPFYSLFSRDAGAHSWVDYGIGFCGTGAGIHRLAPGKTIKFTVAVPAKYMGHHLRVELSVRASPKDTKPVAVSGVVSP